MHEICGDRVDLMDFSPTPKQSCRVAGAVFVLSVAGHEIICRSLIHIC